jgi:hypothetical protein
LFLPTSEFIAGPIIHRFAPPLVLLGIFLFGNPTRIGLLVDDGCDDKLPVQLFPLVTLTLVSSSVLACGSHAGPTVLRFCSSKAAVFNFLLSLNELADVERCAVVRIEVSESISSAFSASFRPKSLNTDADTGLLVLSICVKSGHNPCYAIIIHVKCAQFGFVNFLRIVFVL